MPERFLPENRDAIPRFAYLPFGAGPRVCIGQSFSLQEAVMVLAHVARAVRFTLPDDHAAGDAAPPGHAAAGARPARWRSAARS